MDNWGLSFLQSRVAFTSPFAHAAAVAAKSPVVFTVTPQTRSALRLSYPWDSAGAGIPQVLSLSNGIKRKKGSRPLRAPAWKTRGWAHFSSQVLIFQEEHWVGWTPLRYTRKPLLEQEPWRHGQITVSGPQPFIISLSFNKMFHVKISMCYNITAVVPDSLTCRPTLSACGGKACYKTMHFPLMSYSLVKECLK